MTLPQGWVETTLGEIADFIMGQAPPGSECNVAGEGTPFVKAGEFGPSRPVIREWTTKPLKLARHDDVLVCVVGATAGKMNLGADCAIGRSVAAIRPSAMTTAAFIYPRLKSEVARLRAGSTGTAQGVISKEMLGDVAISLPPLVEQRRIVAKLDALTARLGRARAELERTTISARHLRSATLLRCFSDHKTATPLGILLTGIEAGKNLRCEERPPHAGERGVVKVSAVTWGRFDPKQSKTLPEGYNPPSSARIRAGDLLISRANTLELVGATVLVDEEPDDLYLSDKILRLVMPDADKRWVMWFLRSEAGRREIEQKATGNQLSMRNISQGALRAIPIPFPDADVRTEGVKMIEAAFARADCLEAEVTRARALIDRLEAAILAKAFRGELVPQDPNDEPASVLLDRIRAERAAAPKPKRGRARKAVG